MSQVVVMVGRLTILGTGWLWCTLQAVIVVALEYELRNLAE